MKFKWDPKDYKESSSVQYKFAQGLIAKLNLKGNEKILDIGSGDGRISAEISQLLTKGYVVGIDNSDEMVKFSRDTYPKVNFHNLYFKTKEATELNFEDEFDLVFSCSALHWVKDHQAVLRGIKRGLKQKGRGLLQMGGKGNVAGFFTAVKEVIAKEHYSKYFKNFHFPYYFYTPDDYNLWLKEAGLINKRTELIPVDMVHEGIEGFHAWIRTTGMPFTEKVPHDIRDEFIHAIIDNYSVAHPPDELNNIIIKSIRLEVEFEKK